jgi:hypothetical protein
MLANRRESETAQANVSSARPRERSLCLLLALRYEQLDRMLTGQTAYIESYTRDAANRASIARKPAWILVLQAFAPQHVYPQALWRG